MHLITGAFVCALASAAHISVEVDAGGVGAKKYIIDAASQDGAQSGNMVRRSRISKHSQAMAVTAKAQLGEDYQDNQAVVDETKPGVPFNPADEANEMTKYIKEEAGKAVDNLKQASPEVITAKTEKVEQWCEKCNVLQKEDDEEGGQLVRLEKPMSTRTISTKPYPARSKTPPKSARTISTKPYPAPSKTPPKSARIVSTKGDVAPAEIPPPEFDHTSASEENCVNPDEPKQQYCGGCFKKAVTKCTEAMIHLNRVTKADEKTIAVKRCTIDLACNAESVCSTWKSANCIVFNSLIENETQQATMPDPLEQEKDDALAGLAQRTWDAADAIGNGLDSSLDGKCN